MVTFKELMDVITYPNYQDNPEKIKWNGKENEDHYFLQFYTPGIEKEKLNLSYENKKLKLHFVEDAKQKELILSVNIDPNKIETEYKNGRLDVKAYKNIQTNINKIKIN